MPQLLNRVQPGDLITANMWNAAVDAINQLLLAKPVSNPMVTAMSPRGTPEDPIRINDVLQIVGQNFGYTTGQAKVTFEGAFGRVEVKRSEMLMGSSDTRLLFIVPPIPTATDAGMMLNMRVDSGIAQDVRSVFIAPIVIDLTGDLFVKLRSDVTPNPNPNPLAVSQSADFALELKSAITKPARFTLFADITNATAALPANFVSAIEFLENGTVIANKTIELGTDDTRNLIVRLPALPATFSNESFTLDFLASAGTVRGPFSRTFTVGTAVQPSDPTIDPQLTGQTIRTPAGGTTTNPANGSLSGTTIKLKKDYRMTVFYNVNLTGPAGSVYDLTLTPKQGTTADGWTAAFTADTSTQLSPGANQTVKFTMRPSGATIAPAGTFVLRIKRQGATNEWFQEFPVELLP